jgi:hypothetical protein
MNLKLSALFLSLASAQLFAKGDDLPCNPIDIFVPFNVGIEAVKTNNHQLAFDIFCDLSFKGDYRAQFRLAKYYDGTNQAGQETNKVYAWVWANLSNSVIKSTNRARYIADLTAKLSVDEMQEAKSLLLSSQAQIPSGGRFDQQFEPLDYDKIKAKYEKETESKEYTGSRIKQDEPPKNLGIWHIN